MKRYSKLFLAQHNDEESLLIKQSVEINIKRILDLVLAMLILIVLLPVLVPLALLVYYQFGSPIFFRQRRPGLHGRPFTLLKFRTMTNVFDLQGNLLPDGERLTPLGHFLRSTSLDELPELINVFQER